VIGTTLASLRECLCAELAKPNYAGQTEDVCFCGVVAGDSTLLEYVRDQGVMGWVRLSDTFPSQQFPEADAETNVCNSTFLAYEVEVGIGRCAPIGDRVPPTEEEWLDLALAQANDIERLRRAIHCCLSGTDQQFVLGSLGMIGPQGGVLATSWTVLVSEPVG